MNQEIKKEWVEALRSGNYKQTTGKLKDGYGYCCLGVLCDLAVRKGIISQEVVVDDDDETSYFYDRKPNEIYCQILPESVMKWADLNSNNPSVDIENPFGSEDDPRFIRTDLANINDEFGWDFKKIADIIKEQL